MRWTKEHLDWLEENANRDRNCLINKFNKKFNTRMTMTALKSLIYRYNLKIPSPRVRWTKDKLEWLESQSYDDKRDLLKAFNERYGAKINIDQLSHIAYLYKLSLPDTKRIYKPQGTVMYKKHGIPQIKIKDRVYQSKHRFMYEKYHNVKLNDNDMIIFLNGNKNDFSKENLYKITHKINGMIKGYNMQNAKSINKISLIKFCEWKEKIIKLNQGEQP